jgi:arginyl-tRNA synthetase
MKGVIADLIYDSIQKEMKQNKQYLEISKEDIEKLIEIPPVSEMGDYAFPCFALSKLLKQPPNEIALFLRKQIGNELLMFQDIQTSGPYLNFFVNRFELAKKTIAEIKEQKNNYGKMQQQNQLTTMVEFPSPNTNKPLHLGHLRNMAIGESVSRILEFNGDKVIRANLNNDRGIHICKSMIAYQKYGKNNTPLKAKKKSDHFVGDFYVMFNNKSKEVKSLEQESQNMLQKWEDGDKKTLALWTKMNKWALDGFKKTYKKFEIAHDVEFFESQIYKNGKDIILNGLKENIFSQKKDGAIAVDLSKEGLGEKILLRTDGTSVYITQDLYLAKLKFEKYKLDKSIYVVGNEQEYHFNVLFSVLKKLGFEKQMHHLSYGMVELPEGKMKSREGTVVDGDDLIEKVQNLVKKELTSRAKLSNKELENRSLIIALSAIKYILLKVDIKKNMIFNPKESINFEGDTGPYILYSYARASSILRKIKKKSIPMKFNGLMRTEVELSKKLSEFPLIVEKSYEQLNPTIIANYSYQLSQIFNEFYHECPVLGSEKEHFRKTLVESFKQVLANALHLLGIDTLEEM